MDALELERGQARIRPELLGLVALLFSAIAGWSSLLRFSAACRPFWPREAGFQVWLDLVWVGGLCVFAAYVSRKCGLLDLACAARGRATFSSWGRWLCLLTHFRLSFAVLVASLAVGWWGRAGVVLWLAEPALGDWGPSVYAPRIYFDLQGPPWLLIMLSVAWLPVVPFLASDVWRLLRPLMPARAARLNVPFALASAVALLGAVLFVRWWAIGLFAMLGPPTSALL
ncbi:MAG TPA: hypothetical protein VHP33_05195 [Polyangiaceae bacterium]|nr:hypothetical protein [Polyangiaceae bacterium]